ncbi:acyl-CoA thioesterase [Porcipelethomonas sp.]|uniref:acyl-CoA thioesterase n=1 Tax=Porcipelethomonas sp. TaxID=2981675 RepID=UPI003EF9C663
MENIHVYERDAHYYETDKMGIIHHSNYIRWFEEARVDFMQKAGYPYDVMESTGIMMPVLSAECSYKSSVRFGDTVLIYTAISQFNGFKMQLQYKVCDKKTGELRVYGSTSHCFTDMSMKPLRIKKTHPEIYDIFDKISPQELF